MSKEFFRGDGAMGCFWMWKMVTEDNEFICEGRTSYLRKFERDTSVNWAFFCPNSSFLSKISGVQNVTFSASAE